MYNKLTLCLICYVHKTVNANSVLVNIKSHRFYLNKKGNKAKEKAKSKKQKAKENKNKNKTKQKTKQNKRNKQKNQTQQSLRMHT